MWKTEFERRLGKDPEMRYLPDGRPVTDLRVAVNWQEKGEKRTEWLGCSVFGDLAEKANQELKKGDLVRISGTARTRLWERGDGSVEKSIDVNVIAFANAITLERQFDN